MGEYIPIDEDLISELNEKEPTPLSVSKLFCSCLLFVKNVTLMILTSEVYLRDVYGDRHAETTFASYPQTIDRADRFYSGIKIASIKQSEGGQPVQKLIIGTTTFNVLVTSTFLLTPRDSTLTTVGPSAPQVLNGHSLDYAQILLRKSQVDEYLKAASNSTKFDESSLRQLTSAMDDATTYLQSRACLFEDLALQPATVFTVFKLPFIRYSLPK